MANRTGPSSVAVGAARESRDTATLGVMDAVRVLVQAGTGYDLLISAVAIADRSAVAQLDRARAAHTRERDRGRRAQAIDRTRATATRAVRSYGRPIATRSSP
jgi:hypothetical protein